MPLKTILRQDPMLIAATQDASPEEVFPHLHCQETIKKLIEVMKSVEWKDSKGKAINSPSLVQVLVARELFPVLTQSQEETLIQNYKAMKAQEQAFLDEGLAIASSENEVKLPFDDKLVEALVEAVSSLKTEENKEARILEGIALSGNQALLNLYQEQWLKHSNEMHTEANIAFLRSLDFLDQDIDVDFYGSIEKELSLIGKER